MIRKAPEGILQSIIMRGRLRLRGELPPLSVDNASVGSATPARTRKRPRSAVCPITLTCNSVTVRLGIVVASAAAACVLSSIPLVRTWTQHALHRVIHRQGVAPSSAPDSTKAKTSTNADRLPSTLHVEVHTNAASTVSAFIPPSKAWLEGTRMGNVHNGLTKQDIENLIVVGARGSIDTIISESVCCADSPVATSALVDLSSDTTRLANLTRAEASQLIYRAIHENQYGPARKEAENRLEHWEEWQALATATNERHHPEGSANVTTSQAGLGLFDFECPNAKFLLFDGFTVPVGLGSNLRHWGNVGVFGTALSHQRVFLYVSGERPSVLASCDRLDMQCSFAPMSPCVITKEEMDAAPVADHDLDKFLRNNPNERILRVVRKVGYKTSPGGNTLQISATKTLPTFGRVTRQGQVYGLARTLEDMSLDLNRETLKGENEHAFVDAIVTGISSVGDGIEAKYSIEAAAHLFITRPNRSVRAIINKAIHESFSSTYDPVRAVGMPIRASDKCRREADCIEFTEYMEQLQDAFPMYDMKWVVLTSEDEKILHARDEYEEGNDVDFDFIANRHDVAQGSGAYGNLPRNKKNYTKEDVVASTLSAWAFQLKTGHSFLNLCSNFHVLIQYSINYGCSMASRHTTKEQNVTCNLGKKRQIVKMSAKI